MKLGGCRLSAGGVYTPLRGGVKISLYVGDISGHFERISERTGEGTNV